MYPSLVGVGSTVGLPYVCVVGASSGRVPPAVLYVIRYSLAVHLAVTVISLAFSGMVSTLLPVSSVQPSNVYPSLVGVGSTVGLPYVCAVGASPGNVPPAVLYVIRYSLAVHLAYRVRFLSGIVSFVKSHSVPSPHFSSVYQPSNVYPSRDGSGSGLDTVAPSCTDCEATLLPSPVLNSTVYSVTEAFIHFAYKVTVSPSVAVRFGFDAPSSYTVPKSSESKVQPANS